MSDSVVREAGTSSRNVERLSEALEPQDVEHAICKTQIFVLCSGEKMPQLRHSTLEIIQECSMWYMEGSSWFTPRREWKRVVSIHFKMAARIGKHYLSSFSTEGVVLDKIVLKEVTTESWISLLTGENRKRDIVLNQENCR